MNDKPEVCVWRRRGRTGRVSYTVRWVDPATGHYRSKACGSDKEAANDFKAEKRRSLRDGTDRAITSVDWDSFVAAHLAMMGKTPKHRSNVKKALDEFGGLCKPSGPHVVTFVMLERYVKWLRDLPREPRTINCKIGHIHHALKMAVTRGYSKTNPATDIPHEPESEMDPVELSNDDLRALLGACDTVVFKDPSRGNLWRTFLHLLLTTGCRVGEVRSLTWDKVHLDDAYIDLTRTKAKRQRLQPLSDDDVALLRALRANAVMRVDGGQQVPKEPMVFRPLKWNETRQFDRIRKAAGLPGSTMKAFRSTACIHAGNEGFDVSQAGDFMGHADYKVTRAHYFKRKLEGKRQIAEALNTKIA